jgi:hypothetical protein
MTKFQDVYTPEEQLTIDEAIYPFRGRIIFRVYIKGNPHKYWIKVYELCQAKSGYIYNMEVCPTNSEHNTAFNVVDKLCDKREGSLCAWIDGSPVQRSSTIMGLQNKGGRHSDILKKKKRCLNKHFSGELKQGEKYHASGITSWPSSGRTFLMSFP